jgi:hypothetical protein
VRLGWLQIFLADLGIAFVIASGAGFDLGSPRTGSSA